MKEKIGYLILFSLVGIQFGCGNSVKSSIQSAVEVNQQAESLLEWKTSEFNPEILFAQWRHEFMVDSSKRASLKEDICSQLKALDGMSLSLFENEIRDEDNRALVSDCKDELLTKVNDYFDKERETMAVPGNALVPSVSKNSFRFPTNVQTRDTSNGYFAVTGDVVRKEVVLTFDDGPNSVYTESVLQALREVNAKAIFFQVGKAVRANPDMVRRVAADGHAVGSHSTTHACQGRGDGCKKINGGRLLTFNEALEEIKGGHQAIYDVLGWIDPFFRFPYGSATPELKRALKEYSTGEFFWAIDSNDWRSQSNQNLLNKTLSDLDARGRGIVLFHDIHRRTAEIMPQFLREIYLRGYSVVLLQAEDPMARYNSKLVKKKVP